MTKRLEIILGIIALIVAIVALLFGDNIYQQITGRSAYEIVQPISVSETSPISENNVSSTLPSPTSQQVPSGRILFNDDFEHGEANKWTIAAGKWEVIQEPSGNHVYKGIGTPGWGFTIAGSDVWKDYAFEVKAKSVESSKQNGSFIGLDVRVDWRGSDIGPCDRYDARLEFDNWLGHGKYGGNCGESWEGRFYRVELGKWYLLRYEVVGDTLKFFVDNELMLEHKDGDLKNGYIGLAVKNDVFYFDDVTVTEIGQ